MRALAKWRLIYAEYRQIKSLADDIVDVVSAVLFTLGALAFALGVAAVIGGSHG